MPGLPVDWPPAGHYVVAVSGGADSMVLLDLLAAVAAERGYKLTVAHFDHGMRTGSAEDAAFVAAAAARYDLPFKTHRAGLGAVSEAAARTARHAWLEQTRGDMGARAILTAHHQGDLLETSLLNLARGSGRLGLAPMQASPAILRPLLGASRAELREYARTAGVAWREDPSNADTANPRNLLRHTILPAADPAWRASYLGNLAKLATLNTKIDQSISILLESARLSHETFSLPIATVRNFTPTEAAEYLLAAARALRPGLQLDRTLVGQAAALARTAQNGKRRPLREGVTVFIKAGQVIVTTKTAV